METTYFRGPPADLGTVSLLRVCRQVHEEAAPIFYGNKTFNFSLGSEMESSRGMKSPPLLMYFDNISWLPPHYLRMVKSCVLNVEPVDGGQYSAKRDFLAIQARLQSFADILANRHVLRELHIVYGKIGVSTQYSRVVKELYHMTQPPRDSDLRKKLMPIEAVQNVLGRSLKLSRAVHFLVYCIMVESHSIPEQLS